MNSRLTVYKRRFFVCLFLSILFLFIVEVLNHSLTPFNLHLTLISPVLIVILKAFGPKRALLATALIGLTYDTLTFAPFGFNLILFSILYTTLFAYAHQVKAQSPWHELFMTQATNTLIILTHSIAFFPPTPDNTLPYITSTLINLLASQLLLFPITPWYTSLQASTLKKIDHAIDQKSAA